MLRTQVTMLFFIVFFAGLSSSLVIPERRQVTSVTSVTSVLPEVTSVLPDATEFDLPEATPHPTISSVTKSSVLSSIPTPTETPTSKFDDSGEYIPPPSPDKQYYEDEGADGDSTGFINVSIGAQAGIIIAIVIVGLAIMGGCFWFWRTKQKEWKAALERRRTLRQSRIAAAKVAAGAAKDKGKADGATNSKKGLSSKSAKESSSSSSVVSTDVTVPPVEQSQFDVMTPTDSDSWLKKAFGKK